MTTLLEINHRREQRRRGEPLLQALELCLRRARLLAAPPLLRLHVRLGVDLDPWQVQVPGLATDSPSWLWADGRSELCAAAWGVAAQRCLPVAERFAAARAYAAELLEQVVDVAEPGHEVDVDAPLAWAGLRYAAAPPGRRWAAWAGGTVGVPDVLIYRRRGTTYAVLALAVPAGGVPSALAARLQARLQALRAAACLAAEVPVPPAPGLPRAADEAAAAWQGRVAAAAAAMRAGQLDKVVLARSAQLHAPAGAEFDPVVTAWALRARHPTSVTYMLMGPDGSALVGASPELLVQISGRSLFTQAVAGTTARGRDAAEDARLAAALLASAKDRAEHNIVVQALQAQLQPGCLELDMPATPGLLRLPRLQHLETPFAATLRQAGGILAWVALLHPTPAVGGAPAGAAAAWLQRHEPLDRGLYAGPVGWLTAAGDGAFAVAIRSVWLQGPAAVVYAGAGIVAVSSPAAEWRETEMKLDTACDGLRLRPLRRA